MAKIRKIEVRNFRGIRTLDWFPAAGVNCLIGPGDSGKSTVLDAIDFCLGARRALQFTDADFFGTDVSQVLSVSITIGELQPELLSFETYGLYHRGFDAKKFEVIDEPHQGSETVLTVRLEVTSDLEPSWSLYSERARERGNAKFLSWKDRQSIAPTSLGNYADQHLSWRRGSVLNKLSEVKLGASGALAEASREARRQFGDSAGQQVSEALGTVWKVANELGVSVGGNVQAMLDPQSISLSGGTVSLHNDVGIPLRGLGLGSTRLLVAGLQKEVSKVSAIVLVDEVEHGLEPHRIVRLLQALGAKDAGCPLQVFATTHSPVALRELSGTQLVQILNVGGNVRPRMFGAANDIQSMLRVHPEAFLSRAVLVCEGASEVGFVRGLDLYRSAAQGKTSISALGVCLVDAGGVSKIYSCAQPIVQFGYRSAVFRDSDAEPKGLDEKAYESGGGSVFFWPENWAIEDALFCCLSHRGVQGLLQFALQFKEEALVNDQLRSASAGSITLNELLGRSTQAYTVDERQLLARVSRSAVNPWFKSVTKMEAVALQVVGPDLINSDPKLVSMIERIFAWAGSGADPT